MLQSGPMNTTVQKPIERAIEIVGSAKKLAEILGVTSAAITQWKDGRVPAERCPEIERATQGRVLCEELRHDVAWDVIRKNARKRPQLKAEEASEK